MDNPNFNPTYSTWDIWRAGEQVECLDDDLNTIKSDIEDLKENKANANHEHSSYAAAVHTHSSYVPYSELEDYALANHTHANYEAKGSAASALTSANAYTDSKVDALVGEGASTTLDTIGEISAAIEGNQDAVSVLNAAIGNKANVSDLTSHTGNKSNPHSVTLTQLGVNATAAELNYVDGVTSNIQTQLNGKAASSHTHTEYATSDHTHSYAASSHNHSASNITTGTLPLARGGTGQTVAKKDVTINRGSNVGTAASAFGYDCQYIPYLNMCFVRVYAQPKEAWTADAEYEVGVIDNATYNPASMMALSNYAQKEVAAYINTDGKIVVRPYEGVGTSYGIRLAGFWFCE